MSEKKDCKIIQDLLPNYIEELTNEETNKYIENHLNECSECKIVLENMQKELKSNMKNRDKREVDYIKKFRNKLKFLKLILVTIVLIYVIIVLRKAIIMTELGKRAEKYKNSTNYYQKVSYYMEYSLHIIKSYRLNENYFSTMDIYDNYNNVSKRITYYKNENEEITLVEENDGQKYLKNCNETVSLRISPHTEVSNEFLINIQSAIFVKIEDTYCNGRECYVIRGNGYERYIDKETGLAIRMIDRTTKDIKRIRDTIVDVEYKFDIVKESDIVKPDISKCIEN